MVSTLFYGSGGDEGEGVSRKEADWLFELNDAVSGAANDPGWQDLMAKAISSHVLADETSPGVLDADEASWLIGNIESDGTVDDVEKAIIKKVLDDATSVDQSFTDFASASGVS